MNRNEIKDVIEKFTEISGGTEIKDENQMSDFVERIFNELLNNDKIETIDIKYLEDINVKDIKFIPKENRKYKFVYDGKSFIGETTKVVSDKFGRSNYDCTDCVVGKLTKLTKVCIRNICCKNSDGFSKDSYVFKEVK